MMYVFWKKKKNHYYVKIFFSFFRTLFFFHFSLNFLDYDVINLFVVVN